LAKVYLGGTEVNAVTLPIYL
ncbi:hypothetical protein CF326_g9659, partial [Tilletia indica]